MHPLGHSFPSHLCLYLSAFRLRVTGRPPIAHWFTPEAPQAALLPFPSSLFPLLSPPSFLLLSTALKVQEILSFFLFTPTVTLARLPLSLACSHLTVIMCRETVTIAQCAPKVSPVLAFYCAKLHLVAKDHTICDAAKGKCICFFGSCGTIDREIPTKGINLSELVKARCAECTPREHRVGNGIPAQQILESVLLRSTDGQNGWEERSKLVSELWLNKTACPYHVDTNTTKPAPIAEVINITEHFHLDTEVGHSGTGLSAEPVEPTDPTHESTELKPSFEAAVGEDSSEFSSSDNAATKDASSSPVATVFTEPVFADSIVAEPASFLTDEGTVNAGTAGIADEWTTITAPAGEQDDNADDDVSHSGAKNILDPEEVGISTSRWAPGNSPTNSLKPPKPALEVNDKESVDGQEHEQEQAQPPVVAPSRRAVNFSYNPDNAEKLLETAELFANVKKAFLMGKA
ncbi:cytochrome P450 monooxygenase [Fusarium mundagurra]|uniref:Cytochrome P450 monooxygenase n=1 Tax=Fusarium mundagurra TaxID=1567541 RepID=A0A8H5YLA4_9HYPO|nr:cytochrome P450 monooxygenase [Fusarium mundagurra]